MFKPAIGAALALVTACAAQTPARVNTLSAPASPPAVLAETRLHEPGSRSPVACDIEARRTARGLRLEALAYAGDAVHGDYEFTIAAQGPGGSSDITQGGAVDLDAGQRATLGDAEIPDGPFRAVLTLSNADGELCRLEQQS